MKPLITIIIPSYDRFAFFNETIKSVENQTYSNWECIIVDDGSTKETISSIEEKISLDKRFVFFKRVETKTKGPSSSRNIGIEKAKGSFVIFLDSDDLLSKDCLQNRIDFYLQNPTYDFYIFKTQIFNTSPNDSTIVHNIELNEYTDENYLNLFLLGKTPFCIMSPLWKIETLKRLNGFDENLVMLEDPDLHIRAFLNKLKSLTDLTCEPDSFYRQSKDVLNKQSLIKYLKTIDQYFYFISKHLSLKNKTFDYFALKFYKNIVINKEHFNFKIILKYYLLFYKNKVLNNKKLIFILPLSFLIYLNSKFSFLNFNKTKEFIFQ